MIPTIGPHVDYDTEEYFSDPAWQTSDEDSDNEVIANQGENNDPAGAEPAAPRNRNMLPVGDGPNVPGPVRVSLCADQIGNTSQLWSPMSGAGECRRKWSQERERSHGAGNNFINRPPRKWVGGTTSARGLIIQGQDWGVTLWRFSQMSLTRSAEQQTVQKTTNGSQLKKGVRRKGEVIELTDSE
jgi:hypothetical protein